MLDSEMLAINVRYALAEDLGAGDLTAKLIGPDIEARATVVTREDMVLCGRPWMAEVFRQIDETVTLDWAADDGDRVEGGQTICTITGKARSLLSGERTALNFIQTLSGTATLTRQYVEALTGYRAVLLDTRKTIPGLRGAQKYAVRAGGGENHRQGLFDEVLIKENHISACGGIAKAVLEARSLYGGDVPVTVEVEDLEELAEALGTAADKVLLDNFTLKEMTRAVTLRGHNNPAVMLEVSGNVALDGIGLIAATGIDYISVGALTKNVRAVDLSMRFDTCD